jgi:hypothetical protein
MSESRRTRKRSKKHHAATFEDAAIHFTLAVHTRKSLKIGRASRRLLDRDIAVSAAWPSESQIRVASRFAKHGRSMESQRSLIGLIDDVMRDRSWRSFIRLALRHPGWTRQSYRLVAAKKIWPDAQEFNAHPSLRALVRLTARHPIISIRYVWPHVKFSRKEHGEEKQDQVEELLEDFDPHDEGWRDEVLQPMYEADKLYLDRQLVSAAEREQDAELFGGRDRESDGFVRLVLRNSYHDLLIPGRGNETQHVVFEPRLFLHWSGVALLTIRISSEGPLSADDVIDLMWGPAPRIVRSRMAAALVRKTWLEPFVTGWDEQLDAGAKLAILEWDSAISMTDILHGHMQLVEKTIGTRFRHSLTYPISIVQAGGCCSPKKFQKNHHDEIARITMRMPSGRPLAPQVTRDMDWSLTTDHSLFVNLGSTSYFQWDGPRPFGLPELQTTLVVEYGLTLYKRLQAMEENVSRMRLGDRQLRRRYRDAILLFSELRQGDVRAGTARVIVRHLLRDMGADQMRPTIESALNLASMAHGTVSAENSSRRAWWLGLVGTVVALVVSVPTISTMLSSLPAHGKGGPVDFLLDPLRSAEALGFWGPWAVVGAIFLVLLSLWFIGTVIRSWPRLQFDVRRGYAWPTQFEVSYEADEDDPEGDGDLAAHDRT